MNETTDHVDPSDPPAIPAEQLAAFEDATESDEPNCVPFRKVGEATIEYFEDAPEADDPSAEEKMRARQNTVNFPERAAKARASMAGMAGMILGHTDADWAEWGRAVAAAHARCVRSHAEAAAADKKFEVANEELRRLMYGGPGNGKQISLVDGSAVVGNPPAEGRKSGSVLIRKFGGRSADRRVRFVFFTCGVALPF